MKIVVDTNIVFSAMLNLDSRIAKILLLPGKNMAFFTCTFLKLELFEHKQKLIKHTGYSESDFFEMAHLITKNIQFVVHLMIDHKILQQAKKGLAQVDVEDAPFLALALQLNAKLWTGDKRLYNFLSGKGYRLMCSTSDLIELSKN